MEKIIVALLILIFSNVSFANEEQDIQYQQQEKAGAWVNDWWENVKDNQLKEHEHETIVELCVEKLKFYNKKIKEKPQSDYYSWKFKMWNSRCEKYKKDIDKLLKNE